LKSVGILLITFNTTYRNFRNNLNPHYKLPNLLEFRLDSDSVSELEDFFSQRWAKRLNFQYISNTKSELKLGAIFLLSIIIKDNSPLEAKFNHTETLRL
jgi:hypothetical protein